MKCGISSYAYSWSIGVEGYPPARPWNETDLIKKAVHLKANCIQIADNLPLHAMNMTRLNNLKKLAEANAIEIEVGARKMNLENLHRYIEISEFFHSSILRFVIDGDKFEPSVGEIIGIIQKVVPELKRKKIVLAIENHDRLKAIDFKEIVRSSGSENVGICLDSVNSMGAGEGIETVTTILAPYTCNLHVKEFIVERHAHMMGFTIHGCPLGTGQLPLAWLLKKTRDKCRSAILEQWIPPEETLENTIQKEQQWAEEGFSYLKKKLFRHQEE